MQIGIKDFPLLYPEINWYAGDAITVHGVGKDAGLQERKRVLSSLSNFNFVLNDDYDSFVSGQLIPVDRANPAGQQQLRPGSLSRERFAYMRHLVMACMQNQDFITMMETLIAIHDVTKVLAIIDALRQNGITADDPDKLLGKALTTMPDFFPSVSKLQPFYKSLLISMLSPGINGLQFVQGEALYQEVAEIRECVNVWKDYTAYYIIFECFDLAGAAGNAPITLPAKLAEASAPDGKITYVKGSITFDEATAKNFFEAWTIINENTDAKVIYDKYMQFRADLIRFPTPLYYHKISFALSRIAAMGRLVAPNDGEFLFLAFDDFNLNYPRDAIILISELSDIVFGTMIYYAPQLVVDRLAASPDRKQNLIEAMRLLVLIYESIEREKNIGGIVPRVVNIAHFVTFLKARDNPNTPNRTAEYHLFYENDFLEPKIK